MWVILLAFSWTAGKALAASEGGEDVINLDASKFDEIVLAQQGPAVVSPREDPPLETWLDQLEDGTDDSRARAA